MLGLMQRTARAVAAMVGRDHALVRMGRPIFGKALMVASGRRGIPWTLNGESFRIDPRFRMQLGEAYDPPVAEYIRSRMRPGAVCLDVGANVGAYVLQLARWTGRDGTVYAFEPNPTAAGVLRRHIAMNAMEGQVEIIPAAVGRREGTVELHASEADGMSRLGSPNAAIADRTRTVAVPLTTLDAFCDQRGLTPDWIIIDIEGFELAALEGARRLLDRAPSIRLVVEMHPSLWPDAGTTPGEAASLLRELGYRIIPLSGQRTPLADHGLVALERVGS